MYYKSYSDLSHDIKSKMVLLANEQFDLVVGIPRSGMIPAYMIAFNLNINCTSVESFLNNDKLCHGNTRTPNCIVKFPWDAKKILLVDDSIKSGASLERVLDRIPESFKSKITTLAIYTGKSGSTKVDMFIEYLPWPRLFEWNILHHSALPYYCFGIDGVLCEEVVRAWDENEEIFRKNLLNAKPLIIPNTKIHSLVTHRAEKYRFETETWLALNKVQYENLIMLNQNGSKDLSNIEMGIKHKSSYYKKSNTILFVEKDPIQAKKISKASLKPVYCFTDNQMYMPHSFDLFKNNLKYIPIKIKRLMVMFLKHLGIRQDLKSTLIPTSSQVKGIKKTS